VKRSLISKRSIVIEGHKTSISLEDAFWSALKGIACQKEMRLSELVGAIDRNRSKGNLSSCVRLFVLNYFTSRLTEKSNLTSNSDRHCSSARANPEVEARELLR